MSKLQDQEGRRIRLPGHGISVTDVKPSGLMAVRPASGPFHKAKEGVYQNKKGISLSSVMVKAIKSALLEAAEYNPPNEGKRKMGSAGLKSRPQSKNAVHTKCNTSTSTGAQVKKSMNVLPQNHNKKKVTGLMSKLELISRMNMEGVGGPKCTTVMERPTSKKGRPGSPSQAVQKKKNEFSPTRAARSPARKVQKENSKRKSMVSVPAGSPDRKTPVPKKPANQTQSYGPSVKATNQLPGCLETRNRLTALSLDHLPLARTNTKPHKQRIEPDMTTYEFMRRLMSYSTTSFRDLRTERRTVKTPKLDSIPEES